MEQEVIISRIEILHSFKKALAFIKRDFFIETSYKFQFTFRFIDIFITVTSFYFLSKLIGDDFAKTHLAAYGGDYFSFVLVGIAFSNFLHIGLVNFVFNIRKAMTEGSLEAMLCTPTKPVVIVMLSSIWQFLFESLRVFIYLLLGLLLFGITFLNPNYLGALIILILTIAAFGSLGIISASIIMVLKRGDPINWIFSSVSSLLGGVLFPITILPAWLKTVSYLLPITHSLNGVRLALLQGYSMSELAPEITALVVFSIIVLPLSILICNKMTRKAKVLGNLSNY
jgi:ABC-2 type transport system permease protein